MHRLQSVRDNFREKVFGAPPPPTPESDVSIAAAKDAKEDEDIAKKERGLKQLLFYARKKYIERGLEGSIEIYSLFTIFSHSVSCEVSREGPAETVDEEGTAEDESLGPEAREEVSRANATAISAMDGVLAVLERRAKGYRHTSFRDDVTLSSGVYITVPFIGMASISVTFSATVKSLLERSALIEHSK